MPKYIFTNNASSLLSGSILAADTSLSVTTTEGDKFPDPGVGEAFRCVIFDAGGNKEIIEVEARTVDTLSTITRGLEGTTAQDWAAGSSISHRMTAGVYEAWKNDFDGDLYAGMASATGADGLIMVADGLDQKAIRRSPTSLVDLAFQTDIATLADETEIGSYRTHQGDNTNIVTLTSADVGKVIAAYYDGLQLISLPQPSSVPVGSRIVITTETNTTANIYVTGSDPLIGVLNPTGATPYVMQPHTMTEFVSNSGAWYAVSGTGRESKVSNAVYKRMGGGLIVQGGVTTTLASGAKIITFPTPFPSALVGFTATPDYGPSFGAAAMTTGGSKTSIGLLAYSVGGTFAQVAVQCRWMAIGY